MPSRVARAVLDALREALPIHRCARPERCRGCAFSEMGACSGTDRDAHRAHMRAAGRALTGDAGPVLDALERRMRTLTSWGCFERAAQVRERGALLERVVAHAAQVRALVAAGDIVLAVGRRALLVRAAQLAAAADLCEHEGGLPLDRLNATARATAVDGFIPVEVAREARVIASWIARRADEARLLHVSHPLATPAGARPRGRFRPRADVAG
jgi:DNA polymerase-3 subunit epsilon